MTLSQLLRRRTAWASAIFFQNQLTLPPTGAATYLMPSKKLLRGPRHVHTRADPFLFVEAGQLTMFYETQVADDFGKIAAVRVDRSGLTPLGTVLAEPFHLSYPAVFRYRGALYMMPECQGSGELRLYRFDRFPQRLTLARTLLLGRFADPSPMIVGDTLFVFATTARGLELFFTDDLLGGTLEPHPLNPLTDDPAVSRCGGIPFHLHDHLVRPAQNCAASYGANLSLMRIEVVTKTAYCESPYKTDIFSGEFRWNSEGSHHVSIAQLDKGVAVAIDGQRYDYFIHKIVTRAWLTMTRGRR